MIPFFHDQQRDLLVYQLSSRAHLDVLTAALPEARANGQYIAVPRSLRSSQVLRWLNYPVAPIVTDANYEWPIESGRTPTVSQKLMTNFSLLHPRCFNLSDMGTMKTLASLWAADWLMRLHQGEDFRAIIVAPLTILERVWASAIYKNFLSHRTFEILHGDANKRLAMLSRKVDFYIINFDGVGVGAHTRKRFELDGFSKELASRSDIKVVIVDEASAYRDSQTKRHRIARLVFGQKPYLWLLTGTPTPNAPTDAYGLAKLVNNAHGRSFTSFRLDTMYQLPHTQFRWVPKRDGYDKARQLLAPAIRVDIKQVWDGPPFTTQQREVELTAQQKKYMAELKRDFQVQLASGKPITAVNEAAARTKFIQISLGAIYDEHHQEHAIDSEPRLKEAEAVIGQTDRKVVIFVPLTSVINLLYQRLSKHWGCAIINGDVPVKERSTIISRFEKDDELRIVICDPGTTAHGINEFVAANVALWYGTTDKGELYDQGNKRLHRPGQKFPTTVVQLVSNPLEREIYRRLQANLSLQGALLDVVRRGEL